LGTGDITTTPQNQNHNQCPRPSPQTKTTIENYFNLPSGNIKLNPAPEGRKYKIKNF